MCFKACAGSESSNQPACTSTHSGRSLCHPDEDSIDPMMSVRQEVKAIVKPDRHVDWSLGSICPMTRPEVIKLLF